MARPVTLFTGQWADLPFASIAEKAGSFGYDGLELACWGDHFEVDKALERDSYIRSRQDGLQNMACNIFPSAITWSGNVWRKPLSTSVIAPSCRIDFGVMATRMVCANAVPKR